MDSIKQRNNLALASMITGIASLALLPCYGAGVFAGIAALIMGIMARRQIQATPQEGSGMALAGMITGGISTALGALSILVITILMLLGPSISNMFSQINSGLIY